MNVLVLTLSILETVLATLAGTYILPVSGLQCGLDNRWQRMFKTKDQNAIRRIQDAFNCCGLHSVKDRAWPFPDDRKDANTCQAITRRTQSCFGLWRREEQGVAGMVLLVVIMVFAWKASPGFSVQKNPLTILRLDSWFAVHSRELRRIQTTGDRSR
jgi:hypothetical protein